MRAPTISTINKILFPFGPNFLLVGLCAGKRADGGEHCVPVYNYLVNNSVPRSNHL